MASPSIAKQRPVNLKEPVTNNVRYPMPQASYEEVVANPELFIDTLRKFHASIGIKSMTPTVGGKALDLHKLFVEVTSRGGVDKIVKERRWKEVTATFKFPPTATNASFVLRKYYVTLLQNYEQLYFSKSRVWTSSSPVTLEKQVTVLAPAQVTLQPSPICEAAASQKFSTNSTELCGASPGLSARAPVIGVIDGKFESGYLVSVTIGSETLKGILYEVPNGHQFLASEPNARASNAGSAPTLPGTQRRRRRKKCEIKRRDPGHPKPNRSGYNFFFAEQHARLKPLHPGKDREISKMIGELWNKIEESQKAVYQEKALKDKERYRIEMEDYREKLRTGRVVSNPAPLQQWIPQKDSEMMDADIKFKEMELGDSPMSVNNGSSSGESEYEDDVEGNEDMHTDATCVIGSSAYSGNIITEGSAEDNEKTSMDENAAADEKMAKKAGELGEEKVANSTT